MNRLLAPFAALVLLIVLSPSALAGQKEDTKAADAARVLGEIMRIPETSVPEKMFTDAHAIAVIPDVVKAGLFLGGRGGTGLISVRSPDGTWSNPSFIKLGGGSIGFQAGVQSSDVILGVPQPARRGQHRQRQVHPGADASVAAGPVGRSAQASTDEQFKAEIYSYSRARGLFAGVALDGTVLRINHKANEAVYGRNTTPRQIFEGRVDAPSSPVVDFRDRLEENTVPQD
ncbi:lipid-binding SYLF domain-containing protein [Arenimonas daejeonensis]|uniref:lipid-binding SYLF domain-containing protein n=1 Tax=Arenimonas daejeonensis TaxID=370777 RepID=UPI001315A1AC|nr:lipid-binding SYLF domain-containing protein [Arenimonas daejeonensis]